MIVHQGPLTKYLNALVKFRAFQGRHSPEKTKATKAERPFTELVKQAPRGFSLGFGRDKARKALRNRT